MMGELDHRTDGGVYAGTHSGHSGLTLAGRLSRLQRLVIGTVALRGARRTLPESRDGLPIFLATIPPTAKERQITSFAIGTLLVALVFVYIFAKTPLGRIEAVIAFTRAMMFLVYLLTAVLLFAQFPVQRRRAILAIASGYLFASLAVAMQAANLPGRVALAGLVGTGPQAAAWLYIFRYTGFALFVIVYVLLKNENELARMPGRWAWREVSWSAVAVTAFVVALTLLATSGLLPARIEHGGRLTPSAKYLSVALILLSIAAFILLMRRRRFVLDLWLLVAIAAELPTIALPILSPLERFTLGWYVAAIAALIAASTVLVALIIEMTTLYARLARNATTQQREWRDRLMTVEAATAAVAHELRQPLTEISLSSQLAARCLLARPPDVARAQRAAESVSEACMRANDTITGVLRMFRRNGERRKPVSINDIVHDVLGAMSHDARARGVVVLTDLREGLPAVVADRMQLQEVLSNLVSNAMDAMSQTTDRPRRLRVSTRGGGDSGVSLSVEDSGPGISPLDEHHIFEPFFTTKATGAGLGLSICRSIVERHGGRLRAQRLDPHGSAFVVELPSADASDALEKTERKIANQP